MSDLSNRRTFIGGSDARVIMGDSPSNLVRLWREKRGEIEPEDLSDNLMVQLGRVTEEMNRRWYERNTGYAVTDVQRRIQHPVIKWMAATVDGLTDPGGAGFEAKFMLPWAFSGEAAAEKQMAQLQHKKWGANARPPRRSESRAEKAGAGGCQGSDRLRAACQTLEVWRDQL